VAKHALQIGWPKQMASDFSRAISEFISYAQLLLNCLKLSIACKKNLINSFIEYYTLLAQNSSPKVMKNCLFITHKILLACRTHSECFIRFGWSESLADNFTSKVDICTNVYPYQGQPSSVWPTLAYLATFVTLSREILATKW